MESKDELKTCEYYGDDYTIKVYQREDCRFYSTLLYENEEEAKVVYTSKPQPDEAKARNFALERAKKHSMEVAKK